MERAQAGLGTGIYSTEPGFKCTEPEPGAQQRSVGRLYQGSEPGFTTQNRRSIAKNWTRNRDLHRRTGIYIGEPGFTSENQDLQRETGPYSPEPG